MYVDFQMMKYLSSKMRVFLLVIKTVFPMFARITARFVEVQMLDKCPLQALCGICSRRTVQWFWQSNRKDSLSARKTRILRTVGISHLRKSAVHGKPQNFLLKIFLNPSFTIAWNIYGRNRIKKYIFYKDYTNIRQSKSWLDSFRGLEWKKRMNQEVKCMDSCDSTGRSSICGGRQKMILAQLAMDFR